ncbi:mRNA-capping enzyme-like [Anoplophora glabripennis]|uniref:mRNA-capping enzyme-like n=1 Tax=Anoplophora glabripennis TaxID=217634 RepID=UPI00087581FF|nr:mRNA-capping enzyme-like [Anoplophora glabripennis]
MAFKRWAPDGPVPDRWLDCPPNGNHLILSKFMPLKTPLNSNFDHQIPRDLRYHPREIFSLAKNNKVKIGLWIDLTNTYRYYRKEDIRQEGCEYVKIKCRGHGQAPTPRDTQFFISVVHEHIVKAPFECIAVHCTHGFNRTGFLITAFLVERLKFDVGTALQIFSESRPPGIYKDDYIKELFKRYGRIEDAPPAPSLPEWCEETVHCRKRKRERNIERTKFVKQ